MLDNILLYSLLATDLVCLSATNLSCELQTTTNILPYFNHNHVVTANIWAWHNPSAQPFTPTEKSTMLSLFGTSYPSFKHPLFCCALRDAGRGFSRSAGRNGFEDAQDHNVAPHSPTNSSRRSEAGAKDHC
jgi:hypothetical protein